MRVPLSSKNPLFYKISVMLHCFIRRCSWFWGCRKHSSSKSAENLPVVVVSHRSLLMRKLSGIDSSLQKNKIQSLRIAASLIDGILVDPEEEFSFWKLVGKPSVRRGFLPGLQLSFGELVSMTGGGLCQLSNLLHWMVLQTPLTITERHRHSTDPFPDYKRLVPFGTGATVFYNYLDFAFQNRTNLKFQVRLWIDEEYLCGEIRSEKALPVLYSVTEKKHRFVRENNTVYRENELWRTETDIETSEIVSEKLLYSNHSEVLYEVSGQIEEGNDSERE